MSETEDEAPREAEIAPCPVCGWDEPEPVLAVQRQWQGDWQGDVLVCPGCHAAIPVDRWPEVTK